MVIQSASDEFIGHSSLKPLVLDLAGRTGLFSRGNGFPFASEIGKLLNEIGK